jgi:hypothetical protein
LCRNLGLGTGDRRLRERAGEMSTPVMNHRKKLLLIGTTVRCLRIGPFRYFYCLGIYIVSHIGHKVTEVLRWVRRTLEHGVFYED